MPKLSVTSRLVMDVKAGPQKHSKDSSRLEKRKLRAHLGAQRNAQLRGMGPFLVGNLFAGLAKAIEMTADRVARHFERLFFAAPVGNHSGQMRNGYLVSRLHRVSCAHGPRLRATLNRRVFRYRHQNHGEIKHTSPPLVPVSAYHSNARHITLTLVQRSRGIKKQPRPKPGLLVKFAWIEFVEALLAAPGS